MQPLRKLLAFFRREQLDADMADELRAHLDEQTQRNLTAGLSPDDARAAAHRQFGGVAQVKERCRDQWRWIWIEQFLQDLRYAFRTFSNRPGFTFVVLISLALGIGANTAIFGLLDAVLWRMLPVARPEELIFLERFSSASRPVTRKFGEISYPLMEALERRSPLLAGATTGRLTPAMLSSPDHVPEPVNALTVADDFYAVLGVRAGIGRMIHAGDTRAAERVVVLSHPYWQRRFGGQSVLGRSLTIDGVSHTVIGVAPREFFGVSPGEEFDVSIPLPAADTQSEITAPSDPRGQYLPCVLARMKPGVTVAQAESALSGLLQQIVREDGLAESAPERIALQRIEARAASHGFDALRRKFSHPLFALLALGGVVLLITCANIANLLLARAEGRSREFAIRVSMGAGRARLGRQLVTESLALSCAGGALGLVLAPVATTLLVRLAGSGSQPIVLHAGLDYRVLLFTAAVSLATGILFGLAPLWSAAKAGVGAVYRRAKCGGGTLSLASRLLVIAQVALSLVLLAGAGLFVRSLENLRTLDSGFRRDHLLLVSVNPQLAGLGVPQIANLYTEILERAAALPSVVAVTFERNAPLSGAGTVRPLAPPGYIPADGRQLATATEEVGPRYFETLGLPVIAGRDFRGSDDRSSPKVIAINESAAREFFPGQNPIGQRMGPPGNPTEMEVIAVVADARHASLREPPRMMVYEPVLQGGRLRDTTFFVRTTNDPAALAPQFQRLVREVDSQVPIMQVTTLEAVARRALVQERLLATLASGFGALALALAGFGLGGVLLFSVTRRTQEIGIRMALGATGRGMVSMVLRESFALVLIGLAIGLPCAWLAGNAARGLLFGLGPTDVPSLAGAAVVLSLAALLAASWPARRATKVDPIVALRTE